MSERAFFIIFVCLTFLLFLVAFLSLDWHMSLDSPIMLYLAYLIDHFHYTPYKDFFDMNTPGVYFINLFIGRYFGYNDFGFRTFDIIYLILITVTTWYFLKKIGWKIAWCGTVLFGLSYFAYGPSMSLQREYIIILPVSLSVLILLSFPKWNKAVKSLIIGFLFGLSGTVKPHSIIGFPVILIFQLLEIKSQNKSSILKSLFLICLGGIFGFSIPILAIFLYLWKVEALSYFFEIVKNYWPLYRKLTGSHQTIDGVSRIIYLLRGYSNFGFLTKWFAPSVIGIFISLFHSTLDKTQKRQILLLIALAISYSIYPMFAGQFWAYHWLPFLYFILLLSSLCFVEQPKLKSRIERLFPVAVIMITILFTIHLPTEFFSQMAKISIKTPYNETVDEIAQYLKSNMKDGDKVQPLDWAGGVVYSMLITKAQIATPFVYEFHFYHHVSNEYIKNLRKRFMRELNSIKPRFIIKSNTNRPWISGLDTSNNFEELADFINNNYSEAVSGNEYIIYEKKSEL